mgnify:CR=1 FL=1
MKKILLLLFILFPLSIVYGYGIENYYFNLNIEDDGSVVVEEYFELNGHYNGMERIIEFKNYNLPDLDPNTPSLGGTSLNNAESIELISIKALPYKLNFNFTNINGDELKKVDYANPGEYGVYTVNSTWYNEKYLIYLPDYNEKAFYLKYRLKNMAVLHNDIAELYWNIPINELKESIYNLKATINIPNNKEIKAWAHGPLNGEITIIDPTKVEATITGINARTPMDVRITFDRNIIKNSPKKSNIEALDKILSKVIFIGAIGLGIVALVPSFGSYVTKIETLQGIGATSLIIMVGVALDLINQVRSHLLARNYESFLKDD